MVNFFKDSGEKYVKLFKIREKRRQRQKILGLAVKKRIQENKKGG